MTSKFARMGDKVTIHHPCTFINPQFMYLNNFILISEFCWLHGGLGMWLGNFIHLANHVGIGGGGKLVMEDFSCVAAGSKLVTGTDDVYGALTNPTCDPDFRNPKRSFIHVGKHGFIGTNVTIMPGITIGEGAVVGAGSVVTRDVEPWTINVGVPCKKVKERPGKDQILKFAQMQYDKVALCEIPWEHYLTLS